MEQTSIDLRAVVGRMVELESEVPQAEGQPDNVAMYVVLALMAGLDPDTPRLSKVLQGEVLRARQLSHTYYAPAMGAEGDHPMALGAVAFLQGVTFARAVADTKGDALRAYLDDAIIHWRHKLAEAEADESIVGVGVEAERARCYVDAYQSVRVSMLGELLP